MEIKSPQILKSIVKNLTQFNPINAKYNVQVQIQMFMIIKTTCLLCVIDPDFENNVKFNYTGLEFD